MKQCPQCKRTYDDSQSFCLMDGTPLQIEGEQETIVRQQQQTATKKSRLLLWASLTGLVILIGAAGAGFLIYTFIKADEKAQDKRAGKTSASPSPTTASTPKPTPTVAANSSPAESSASPSPEESDSDSNTDTETEDITPIVWNTSASTFKGANGTTLKFECPPEGTAGAIWGSDVYTRDSSICTAAVHAGLFSLTDGGIVTIEFRPGRAIYGSTTRNGITSNAFGEYPGSFVVR